MHLGFCSNLISSSSNSYHVGVITIIYAELRDSKDNKRPLKLSHAVYAIATRTHELIKNADTRSYVRKSIKVNELREMLS